MKKALFIIIIAYTACGGTEPDIVIGPTAVKFKYLAEPYPDLNRVLWDTRMCLLNFRNDPISFKGKTYSYSVANVEEILSLWLEIHGPGSVIEYANDQRGYGRLDEFSTTGRYSRDGKEDVGVEGPVIQILQDGLPPYLFVDSTWNHEFFAHRFLDFLSHDGGKRGHDDEWTTITAPFYNCVRAQGCGFWANESLERCQMR